MQNTPARGAPRLSRLKTPVLLLSLEVKRQRGATSEPGLLNPTICEAPRLQNPTTGGRERRTSRKAIARSQICALSIITPSKRCSLTYLSASPLPPRMTTLNTVVFYEPCHGGESPLLKPHTVSPVPKHFQACYRRVSTQYKPLCDAQCQQPVTPPLGLVTQDWEDQFTGFSSTKARSCSRPEPARRSSPG